MQIATGAGSNHPFSTKLNFPSACSVLVPFQLAFLAGSGPFLAHNIAKPKENAKSTPERTAKNHVAQPPRPPAPSTSFHHLIAAIRTHPSPLIIK